MSILFLLLGASSAARAGLVHVRALQCLAELSLAEIHELPARGISPSGHLILDRVIDHALRLLPRTEDQILLLEVGFEVARGLQGRINTPATDELIRTASYEITTFVTTVSRPSGRPSKVFHRNQMLKRIQALVDQIETSVD